MAQILLIDDDTNLLQMVKLMLQRVGHEVQTASDGEKGIAMAADSQPDLAIIDVMMPGLSGYDVVRRMREDTRTARIPIVILTARSQPMDKHMALEAGANAFLSKPVTSQELIDRVDAVLRAGVNYRVHTGLLTEPMRPSSPLHTPSAAGPTPPRQTPPVPARSTSEHPTSPESPLRPSPPPAQFPIITVSSLRGGTGSTTLAVNMAMLLAMRGRRVCLVDLSTTSGHIPLHLHLTPQQTWGDLLSMRDAPNPQALERLLVRHEGSGVFVLPAPPVPSTQSLSTPAIQAVLQQLGRNFNHVIIDAPNLDPATIGALQMSRSVVVVMADDPPSVQSTGQYLIALLNLGVDAGRVRVALVHVQPTPDVPLETIQKALKRPLSAEIPYERTQVAAIRRGIPLAVAEPEQPYAQALEQLARTITT
ncbi:MAG: response regulator [Chloroflexi bacterium]|nr:response regulator [Chloroflexota bacterium]